MQIIAVFVLLLSHTCTAFDFHWYRNAEPPVPPVLTSEGTLSNVNCSEISLLATTRVPKKWIVSRVSQKQRVIVNMRGRKSHIFSDEDNDLKFARESAKVADIQHTTIPLTPDLQDMLLNFPLVEPQSSYNNFQWVSQTETKDFHPVLTASRDSQRKPLKFTLTESPVPNLKISCSDFDFFYLDFNAVTPKQQKNNNIETQAFYPPLLTHFNKPTYKRWKPFTLEDKVNEKVPWMDHNSKLLTLATTSKDTITQNIFQINLVSDISSNNKLPFLSRNRQERASSLNFTAKPIPHTQNDKIKFFELYDSLTKEPGVILQQGIDNNYTNVAVQENINVCYTDKESGPANQNTRKHGKVQRDVKEVAMTNFIDSSEIYSIPLNDVTSGMAKKSSINKTMARNEYWKSVENNMLSLNESGVWPLHPFTAVYINEKFEVHCDAAALNTYWLLASASCLTPHREPSTHEDRSAFVAYCGDSWWNPERIAYVKYINIHPSFYDKDVVRRHIYNVGLIQVETSMASSCPHWTPISIMSHQYDTGPEGSIGFAVGWGLDRYDTSYSSTNLPRNSLAVYKGRIYSSKCPGNSGYKITKLVNVEAAINVYCLSLPPYKDEISDPVHGGILIVEGKVIGLYLQEERRHSGEQSAQYTGVWKLLSWISETAKEPGELDFPD